MILKVSIYMNVLILFKLNIFRETSSWTAVWQRLGPKSLRVLGSNWQQLHESRSRCKVDQPPVCRAETVKLQYQFCQMYVISLCMSCLHWAFTIVFANQHLSSTWSQEENCWRWNRVQSPRCLPDLWYNIELCKVSE